MGMKTISLPSKDLLLKSIPWLSAIEYWLFAGGATAGIGHRSSVIGDSPEALPQASQAFIAT
jgi:hypothetical protein